MRRTGAAAAAPAAMLGPLFSEQWNTFVAWGIGPSVADQTIGLSRVDVPVFVVQSLADTVVLPT